LLDSDVVLFSVLTGDLPRPLPKIKELQGATDITERKGSPSWDYDVCTYTYFLLSLSPYYGTTDLCLIVGGEKGLDVGEA
jgi:hypothetical protein